MALGWVTASTADQPGRSVKEKGRRGKAAFEFRRFCGGPGKFPRRRTDAIGANFDLLPTFARLAGASLPANRTLDGRDLWPLLSGETERAPERFFHYIGASPDGRVNYRGIRDARWKLVVEVGPENKLTGQELYDLGADIGEKFDRSKQHPEIAGRLTSAAQQFYDEIRTNIRPAGRRVTPDGKR